MLKKISIVSLLTVLFSMSFTAFAAANHETMKEDVVQVKSWNHFADLLLTLHKKQISGKDIKQTETMGGYADSPEYFREVKYTDSKSGNLLSVVQWEVSNPEAVHSIEVFVYDKNNRVIRDYIAAFLPYQRNAPVQTLINLHTYNGDLHSFKQFDGSKDLVYEYCDGKLNGKDIQIRLFEDDLVSNDYDTRQLFKSAEYKTCFKGAHSTLGKYIRPQ